MTDDVKEPIANDGGDTTPTTTPQGSELTKPQSQGDKPVAQPTPEMGESQEERTVPLSVLLEERRKARERIRTLQRGQSSGNQVSDQASTGARDIDPRYVQQLQTRVAVSELQEFARDKVKDYPDLPKYLKRAIINNPRGFIKATTSDVESGKLDIEDYLEDEQARYEDDQAKAMPPSPKKTVHVTGGNRPDNIQPGATPADIQKLINTPVDEWTKTDRERLKEYRESHA